MSPWFWVKRFFVSFLVAGLALLVVHLLKGRTLVDAAAFGGLWGAVSAAIFALVGYARYRRNPACMLPK